METFTLRILIYGLVALMPQADGSREALVIKTSQAQDPCDRHYAFLAGLAQDCQAASGSPADSCRPQGDKSDMRLQLAWQPLEGYRLSLLAAPAAASRSPEAMNAGTRCVSLAASSLEPSDSNGNPPRWAVEDPRWTLPLSSMLGKQSWNPELVTSSLRLEGDAFKTCHLATLFKDGEDTKEAATFEFEHPITGAAVRQHLTDLMLWEREIQGDQLILHAEPSNGAQAYTAVLTPKACGDDRSRKCITLYLANLPPRQGSKACPGHNPGQIPMHFAYYYDLFDWTGLRPEPSVYAEEPSLTDHDKCQEATLTDMPDLVSLHHLDRKKFYPGDNPEDRSACPIVE